MGRVLLIMRAIADRPRLFLATFAILLIGAIAGAYVKRPVFESSAKLIVNLDGRGISLSRAEVQYGGAMLQAVEVVTSQVEILRSRKLLEAAVDALGSETFAEPPPSNPLVRMALAAVNSLGQAIDAVLTQLMLSDRVSPRDQLIERVDKELRVYQVRQAQIIQVSFAWRNPQVPPLFLERFLALYLSSVADLNGQSEGMELMEGQVRRASDDLDKAERERRELDTTYRVVDFKREKQALSERIDQLTTVLEGGPPVDPAGAAPDASTQAGVPTTAAGPIAGSQITALRSQIAALQMDRAKAGVGFTADSRQLRELDGQITAAQTALAASDREVRDMLAAHRARMGVLQSAEASYDRVARNSEIASEAFQTYRKVAQDRRLQQAQETKLKIQIVDPPAPPIRPLGWSRLLLVEAGAVFALVMAAAVAGLAVMRADDRPVPETDASPVGKRMSYAGPATGPTAHRQNAS